MTVNNQLSTATASKQTALRKTNGKNLRPAVQETSRRRMSITLSQKSAEAFDWLKNVTDADTDSEVIRNALRVHHVLLQKHISGEVFFVDRDKNAELTRVDLFVAR